MTNIDGELIDSIFKVSRCIQKQTPLNEALHSLSMLQLHVLIFLHKNTHAQMGEIAQYFNIELPSATSLITKLAKNKLIKRSLDKKDRRLVIISLTKQGDNLLKKTMKERNEKITENLIHLSNKDKKELLRIIKIILQKYEK